MKLILLKTWTYGGEEFAVGEIISIDDSTVAQGLIDAGTAKAFEAPAPEPEAKAADDPQEQIRQMVKSELEAMTPKREAPSHVTRVHDRIEDDPKGGWKTFAEFIVGVKSAGEAGRTPDKRLLVEKAASGQNIGVDSEGGFLVPEAYATELLKVAWEEGQILQRCTRMPMSSSNVINIPALNETSRADGSRQGGIRVYRKGEAAQATSSKAAFRRIRLELKKLMGLVYDTDELLRFSPISVETLLTRLFASELVFKTESEIIGGDGASQMLGILNSAALVTVDKEAGQAADTIVPENISNMWSRMPVANRRTAVWLINQDVEPTLDSMGAVVGTGGQLVYMPAGGLSASPFGTLKGRPVIPVEHCQTVGDKGDIMLVDLRDYIYAEDSQGVQSATSIHIRFDYGEEAMRFILMNDGQPWWNSAVTPKNSAKTLSPFITLAARA